VADVTTVSIVDGIKYGFRLLAYVLVVAVVAGLFLVGGSAIASTGVDPNTESVTSLGRVAAGALVTLLGVLFAVAGGAGVLYKIIADGVRTGVQDAALGSAGTDTARSADDAGSIPAPDSGTETGTGTSATGSERPVGSGGDPTDRADAGTGDDGPGTARASSSPAEAGAESRPTDRRSGGRPGVDLPAESATDGTDSGPPSESGRDGPGETDTPRPDGETASDGPVEGDDDVENGAAGPEPDDSPSEAASSPPEDDPLFGGSSDEDSDDDPLWRGRSDEPGSGTSDDGN